MGWAATSGYMSRRAFPIVIARREIVVCVCGCVRDANWVVRASGQYYMERNGTQTAQRIRCRRTAAVGQFRDIDEVPRARSQRSNTLRSGKGGQAGKVILDGPRAVPVLSTTAEPVTTTVLLPSWAASNWKAARPSSAQLPAPCRLGQKTTNDWRPGPST